MLIKFSIFIISKTNTNKISRKGIFNNMREKKPSFLSKVISLFILASILSYFSDLIITVITVIVIGVIIYCIYVIYDLNQKKIAQTKSDNPKSITPIKLVESFNQNNNEVNNKEVNTSPLCFEHEYYKAYFKAECNTDIEQQTKYMLDFFEQAESSASFYKNLDSIEDMREFVLFVQEQKSKLGLKTLYEIGYKADDYKNKFLRQISSPNLFQDMNGFEFEEFCAELLSKNGFYDVSVTSKSGDQGIDIIAHKDNIRYGIQCKLYSSPVGNSAVQQVFSGKAFYKCDIGIVLTNNTFTESAKSLAKEIGIVLWDKDMLNKFSKTNERYNR